MTTQGRSRQRQKGYALLALLLTMSLMIIAAAAVAPTIAMEVQRSKEDEMIHRAMQYRRAIRQYVKQTGRYPMSIEDLNAGGVRCLRKKYKDPMTGRDFRLLHLSDLAQLNLPGQNGGNLNGVNPPDAASSTSVPGTNEDDPTTPDGTNGRDNNASSQPQPGGPTGQPTSGANFGGGVVIGVASTSAKKTIREFDHKNRYNQWLFFYHPAFDTGREIYGPTGQTGMQSLTPGAPSLGGPNSPNGQPQTFPQASQQ